MRSIDLPPRAALPWLLAAILVLGACGGDDGGDRVAKAEVFGDEDVAAGAGAAGFFDAQVFCGLRGAVEQAVGLLLTGGGSVAGAGGGRIVVQGGDFTFEDYSPDGVFTLDGSVVLDLAVLPATVKGKVAWSSGQDQGDIDVDVTVEATADPLTFGGMLTFDGQSVDLTTVDMPECTAP